MKIRRRLVIGINAVAVSVAVVALSITISSPREETQPAPPSTTHEAAPYDWGSLPDGWTELTPPPVATSESMKVWTGTELISWGGEMNYGADFHAGGASYDPSEDTWTPLPEGPLSARVPGAGLWTGREVLLWGGVGPGFTAVGQGAAYSPETETWRSLPEAPLSARDPVGAVWTGTEMIVWGDTDRAVNAVDGAAYSPETDTWRKIADAPAALDEAEVTWTGTELIAFGANLDHDNISQEDQAWGLAYDPATDSWRRLPPVDLSPQASSIAWTRNGMLAWDYNLDASLYEPGADRWIDIQDAPLEFSECYPQSAVMEDKVFAAFCDQAAVFDATTLTWTELDPPARRLVKPTSAGSVVIFAGGVYGEEDATNATWVFKPR